MDDAIRVTLPGGRWVDRRRVTEAWLRPLVGADDAVLLDEVGRTPRPILATTILTRCLTRCGGPEPVDQQMMRSLTVGDREALLWQVRRLSIGDRLDATVTCADCGEKASIELTVNDLLHGTYGNWAPTFTEHIAGHRVEFRLPVGGDQERLSERHAADVDTTVNDLIAWCVIVVDGQSPTPGHLAATGGELAERMAVLDPQAETLLDTTCPACGATITATLDASAFLCEEIAQRSRYLFSEVHVLASTYHWSERDILAMTVDRRHRYLDLIDEARVQERIGDRP